MARVDFYHVTRDPAPVVVARLAERALLADGRMLIVAADAGLRDAVDAALWTANAESFLPHGTPPDASDPIVIGATPGDAVNQASLIALADGVWRGDALDFDRTLFLFDSQQIDDARSAWRMLSKRDDVDCHYWRQDSDGRWVKGP